MMERPAVIEIERRDGAYRIELSERETGRSLGTRTFERTEATETPYKHVCKLRLPVESEPTIDIESDNEGDRIVLRTAERTCYRHALPTPVAAN
ncbi:hypothetical protein [Halalkalicoccus subterraneus]|uniref:hypothetical protein n=1 Tax=Halalkalicoccus subterraneus TaxID=2675002 RepID=UPI0013CF09E6|nr:hypothetical protein [Halalkalicoccus subterraneus]